MSYLIGFAPWLAYFIITAAHTATRDTMLLACAVGFVITLILFIPSVLKKQISSLDVIALIFFPSMAVLATQLGPVTMEKWGPVLGQAAFAFGIGIGIVIKRPFTLTYARAATPQVLWDYPRFSKSQTTIAAGWFAGLLVMLAAAVAATQVKVNSTGFVVLNWVVPIAVVIGVVKWMSGYIAKSRALGASITAERLAKPIPRGGQAVSFLDHVTSVTTPAEARGLYESLIKIGLVRAWALGDFGIFVTGGVRLGNLNLELLGPNPGNDYFDPQFATFEPLSLAGLGDELDRRGIEHGDLIPQTTKINGTETTIYTRMELPGYCVHRELTAQLCASQTPVRTWRSVAPKNRVGLIDVRQVRIRVPDPAAWAKLLAPAVAADDGKYLLSQGPVVRILPGDAQIEALEVRVLDVASAARELSAAGIPVSGNVARVGTLRLELVSGTS